jgi:hypothetical protein
MSNVVVGGLFVLVSLLGQVTHDAWRSRKRLINLQSHLKRRVGILLSPHATPLPAALEISGWPTPGV